MCSFMLQYLQMYSIYCWRHDISLSFISSFKYLTTKRGYDCINWIFSHLDQQQLGIRNLSIRTTQNWKENCY